LTLLLIANSGYGRYGVVWTNVTNKDNNLLVFGDKDDNNNNNLLVFGDKDDNNNNNNSNKNNVKEAENVNNCANYGKNNHNNN
jgi:hypothetical protein